jgi:hypothetical protein
MRAMADGASRRTVPECASDVAAAAASDKAADLARKRFEGGLVDFLEVLDAERTALSAELVFAQSRTDEATSLIAVYKALGAGWICLMPNETGGLGRPLAPPDMLAQLMFSFSIIAYSCRNMVEAGRRSDLFCR